MYNPQLKTFMAVCESGSFSKAADALFLTPSAVLHQIRSLEKDLQAELFHRTVKGVALTPAGEYLQQKALAFIQSADDIRRGVRETVTRENSICIGTSMLEKCRLLYDLWVLFSAENKDCQIRMVNIDAEHRIPEATDLIESLNSNVSWMREWEFLEICRVPFACAVVHDHPLAQKRIITADDLAGETVRSINDGTSETIVSLLKLLRDRGANVVCSYSTGMNMFWESAFTKDVQLVPMCFHDILINMKTIPIEPSFLLPYGIFYRSAPNAAVRRFLDFIAATYEEGNEDGIVPVLT
ncbi:MAG: LysR family transcriptional regulator [Oscillospiraceae bacterium]|nr:LysR family transcriptional regulator [Oscillospiraceae bacterium]